MTVIITTDNFHSPDLLYTFLQQHTGKVCTLCRPCTHAYTVSELYRHCQQYSTVYCIFAVFLKRCCD